jgi:hypothetical protein
MRGKAKDEGGLSPPRTTTPCAKKTVQNEIFRWNKSVSGTYCERDVTNPQ